MSLLNSYKHLGVGVIQRRFHTLWLNVSRFLLGEISLGMWKHSETPFRGGVVHSVPNSWSNLDHLQVDPPCLIWPAGLESAGTQQSQKLWQLLYKAEKHAEELVQDYKDVNWFKPEQMNQLGVRTL